MLRSAELSKPETPVSLVFSEPDATLASLTSRLEAEMAQGPRHIYAELPSALLFEDFELDTWLQAHPDWRASFAGLVSEDAHLLNEHYRSQYEEFSRSSRSAVILGRSLSRRDEVPTWVESRLIDFGKRVDVYEDDLWPRALVTAASDASLRGHETLKTYADEYEEFQLPILFNDSQKMEILLRQTLQGDFGAVWGAEVIRPLGPAPGDDAEVMGLTLVPQALYEWRARPRARCVGLGEQVSLLNVVGVGLEKNNLIQALRGLQLLVDS